MFYAIWRACERFNIDPDKWDNYNVDEKSNLIAFNQIREIEESERFIW